MSAIDKQRIAALRKLEQLGYGTVSATNRCAAEGGTE
jgi:hypothetical protein